MTSCLSNPPGRGWPSGRASEDSGAALTGPSPELVEGQAPWCVLVGDTVQPCSQESGLPGVHPCARAKPEGSLLTAPRGGGAWRKGTRGQEAAPHFLWACMLVSRPTSHKGAWEANTQHFPLLAPGWESLSRRRALKAGRPKPGTESFSAVASGCPIHTDQVSKSELSSTSKKALLWGLDGHCGVSRDLDQGFTVFFSDCPTFEPWDLWPITCRLNASR